MSDLPSGPVMRRQDVDQGADSSEFAEQIVAVEYELVHSGDRFEWFDAYNPRTSPETKYEVKSAHQYVKRNWFGQNERVAGRFRVWESQTRSLVNSDAAGSAWYVFVVLDERESVVDMRRCQPSTVLRMVRDRGGWNDSGHQEMGRQHKLPIDEIF